jgi:hypothetical protein
MSITARFNVFAATVTLLALTFGCAGDDIATGPANNPPELAAVRDTAIALGDTLGIFISATDPDGDHITYHLAVSVTWQELKDGYRADASLDAESGYFWFRPGGEDVPSRQFQFLAEDGRGGEDGAWMTVTATRRR